MEKRGGEWSVFGVDGFECGSIAVKDAVLEFGGPDVQSGVNGGIVYVGKEALEVVHAG